jgi:Flp pilus assembly protein TadG
MEKKNHNDSKCRDRSGMSTVEFALLLPFFALLAAGLFSLEHLVYRSIGQSHAAFSAARRCAVSGSSAGAQSHVRRDYSAFSMPGTPHVESHYFPGAPGVCTVTVRDRAPALRPGRWGRLVKDTRQGAVIQVKAAGTSLRLGGDNDLY